MVDAHGHSTTTSWRTGPLFGYYPWWQRGWVWNIWLLIGFYLISGAHNIIDLVDKLLTMLAWPIMLLGKEINLEALATLFQ
jgi:hypothetical protein